MFLHVKHEGISHVHDFRDNYLCPLYQKTDENMFWGEKDSSETDLKSR